MLVLASCPWAFFWLRQCWGEGGRGILVFDLAGYKYCIRHGLRTVLVGVDVVLRLLLVEKKVAARWDRSSSKYPEVAWRIRPEHVARESTQCTGQSNSPF
ncbi:hypothetical protein K504DRAFT_141130 [Pleomassaria siparia CBS 279.74]|uniref:Uncharacterized protein n=1 Tax=Pleomassaria siparia CBS 279.74 TaxID=1314801 RepID=A0A6G1KMN4_9PLEO|nr:hypothetical protein K504DRAFT_141130 [Pleomassaria siparia CBS 279.74]